MRITRKGFSRPNAQSFSVFSWLCTTACGSAIVGALIAGTHDTYRWIS
jgi:hypothetical protein